MNKMMGFWQWVVQNQQDLARIDRERPLIYPRVLEKLHLVSPGLSCDFELGALHQAKKMIISADGEVSLFPTVMRLVDQAPLDLLPGWQIVAFRQPRNSHFNLLFEDVAISSDQVMVCYKPTKTGKLNITLYIEGINEDLPALGALGMVLLDNSLGEYHTALHINQVAVKNFNRGRLLRDDWVPLIRLQRILSLTVVSN